ncbi:MAG: hypothetical protein OEY78_10610, partial [Gammaproteobacteria bacterium]|nr:hypothetical protein [Gammaproteobacteria bacterium]
GLDIVNESDMAECIVYEEALLTFLKTKFWPKIYHMARRTKTPEFMPYSQMSKVVKAGITNEEISTAVQAALKLGMHTATQEPSLTKRLNHLGRAKPVPPKRLTKTAAEYYLGTNLGKIIQLFDKRWLVQLQKKK